MESKSLLTLKDFTREEIIEFIDDAKDFRDNREQIIKEAPLYGKTLGMIFQKRSTRTRVSTEAAMAELGGHALFLGKDDIQLGVNESLRDTATVLGRMVTGILARVFDHNIVVELAKYANAPVINALSDRYHPLQALADMMTIENHLKAYSGKIAWVGDGNNVCHSLMISSLKLGMKMAIASPKGYEPNQEITEYCRGIIDNQDDLIITNNPKEVIENANVIVTDTFISMGEESQKIEKLKQFEGFQVNEDLIMDRADKEYIFMHCLPRHKEEVSDSIFYGKHSVVFEEAENRLHTIASVLKKLL